MDAKLYCRTTSIGCMLCLKLKKLFYFKFVVLIGGHQPLVAAIILNAPRKLGFTQQVQRIQRAQSCIRRTTSIGCMLPLKLKKLFYFKSVEAGAYGDFCYTFAVGYQFACDRHLIVINCGAHNCR
jgi:hypothetical protein